MKQFEFKHGIYILNPVILIHGLIFGLSWAALVFALAGFGYIMINEWLKSKTVVLSENVFRLQVSQDISALRDIVGKLGVQVNLRR